MQQHQLQQQKACSISFPPFPHPPTAAVQVSEWYYLAVLSDTAVLTGVELNSDRKATRLESSRYEPIEKLRSLCRTGELEPFSALVLLDVFIRHGVLEQGNEKDQGGNIGKHPPKLDFPLAQDESQITRGMKSSRRISLSPSCQGCRCRREL